VGSWGTGQGDDDTLGKDLLEERRKKLEGKKLKKSLQTDGGKSVRKGWKGRVVYCEKQSEREGG